MVWRGLQGGASTAGQRVQAHVTYPGYEHGLFDVLIERMEPEKYLSWRWHPATIERGIDYSQEPNTLVEFVLADADSGTLLRVLESGFDKVPPQRRTEAFRMNSGGWGEQMKNTSTHVATR